jgi:hypothetical protein
LVLGRQGSGKTTKVCAQAARHYGRVTTIIRSLRDLSRVKVIPNFYNHVSLSDDGGVFFITGIAQAQAAHRLEDVLTSKRTILELPHSGWLPKGIDSRFNTRELETKAFVLMLPEDIWRSFPGDVGLILTPELWMSGGPQIVGREQIYYPDDCARIRNDVAQSGIPADYFSAAEEMTQAIYRYLD